MAEQKTKNRVLIVDDSEMNRELLAEILDNEYELTEAENGAQAIEILRRDSDSIDLMLLDIVMPEVDGFEVLDVMNLHHWIDKVPVIMISAAKESSLIERAYDSGVTDYISRPFDAVVVRRRIRNTMMLYAKQKRLMGMVAEQFYEREKSNGMMVDILSHIVEFRNGESGQHVLHIHVMTELLLRQLSRKTSKYNLTSDDVQHISMASALHDIGKIGIPSDILNKPGRLTAEEFEIMKNHTVIGAAMLHDLAEYKNEPLVKIAYEICRWHHERYDGRGYPDGLKGEEIPISAQIVAIADVYDALTSKRCYKDAYSHETAVKMIKNGECGAFQPLLLECLDDIESSLQEEFRMSLSGTQTKKSMSAVMKMLDLMEEGNAAELSDVIEDEK